MFSTVVIGLDPSDTAHHACREGVELAKAVGADIHLVDADLIVIGNKGAHGAGRVLGSVASAVTNESPGTEARARPATC